MRLFPLKVESNLKANTTYSISNSIKQWKIIYNRHEVFLLTKTYFRWLKEILCSLKSLLLTCWPNKWYDLQAFFIKHFDGNELWPLVINTIFFVSPFLSSHFYFILLTIATNCHWKKNGKNHVFYKKQNNNKIIFLTNLWCSVSGGCGGGVRERASGEQRFYIDVVIVIALHLML